MRNSFLQLIYAVLVLVAAGAGEEFLPKFLGVGFPLLLAAVLLMASRRSAATAIAFAVAAGGMEDAISALPLMTSVSFFVGLVAVVRVRGMSIPAALFAYPGYQLWLAVWMSGLGGGVFVRLLLSLPIGVVTVLAVHGILLTVERKAVLDAQG